MTTRSSNVLARIVQVPVGRFYVVAGLAAVIAALASLAIGPTGISLLDLPRVLLSSAGIGGDLAPDRTALVLLGIRLPRTLLGLFVGSSLAVAGVILQGLFRNPLADPTLIGVSSGAALAAISTIAVGNALVAGWSRVLGAYALPVAAFIGGAATTLALVAIASRHGRMAVSTLLLSGIAFAALAGALSGLIAFMSDDRELRDLTLWTMGSLSGASWPKVIAASPFFFAVALLLPRLARSLNGLVLGEAEAFHLGVEIESAKRIAIATTAAAVGAAVAVAGLISFVGLVVPHFARLLVGPDHTHVLPLSALAGGALVVGADILARMLVQPAELPLGIVMALIGAPAFLHLVLNRGAAAGDP